MVAYSFKRRFVMPIQWGLDLDYSFPYDVPGTAWPPFPSGPKTHTIRADRKRHARPGEIVQLYYGMRRKGCFLIGRGMCTEVPRIHIYFGRFVPHVRIQRRDLVSGSAELDTFAKSDGFDDWATMRWFWYQEHGDVDHFEGVMVCWRALSSSEVSDDFSKGDRAPRARRCARARRDDVPAGGGG